MAGELSEARDLLDLGLVLLDAGEDDRAAGCCDCGAICRWCPGQFRARAGTLDEARRRFLALADAPGLAYLDQFRWGGAKRALSGRPYGRGDGLTSTRGDSHDRHGRHTRS